MSDTDDSNAEFRPSSSYIQHLQSVLDSDSDDDIISKFKANTANLNQKFLNIATDSVEDGPMPSKRRRLDTEQLKNEKTFHKGKDIDVIIKRQTHRQERRFDLLVSKTNKTGTGGPGIRTC